MVVELVPEASLSDFPNLFEHLRRCRSKYSRDLHFVQTLREVTILEELFDAERLDIRAGLEENVAHLLGRLALLLLGLQFFSSLCLLLLFLSLFL